MIFPVILVTQSKWNLCTALWTHFGTSGEVQLDRPLALVSLVPRRSEDPLLLVPP